jgi:hypothetical protein
MEFLHNYHDGSRLYKMSARALCCIPIWKGNRIIDMNHVMNIKQSIDQNIQLLDSGYKIIQYIEEDENDKPIRKSYLIDGQHRVSIVSEYFETDKNAIDFIVTVTEIRVESEAEAIQYFNQINNVKPIQFEEDANMILNRYLDKLIKSFPIKMKLFRSSTKRPYLSIEKFREYLQKKVNTLKLISVELFVSRCKEINDKILVELRERIKNEKDKELKMMNKMIDLEFGLAWDDHYRWLNTIIE